MERLTERLDGDGLCYGKVDCEDNCTYCDRFLKVLDKLADYEDAEEQGLILKLPCKVGDKVYLIKHVFCENRKIPMQCNIDEFTFVEGNRCYAVLNGDVSVYMMRRFKAVNIEEFGKTVFLTKEEAEQALKQMGE